MVPLICTQCGGQLEAEEDKVFVAGDTVIVLSSGKLHCPHCGTDFEPGSQMSKAPDGASFSAFDQRGQSVGRQINIVGDGNVIGSGNSRVVIKREGWW